MGGAESGSDLRTAVIVPCYNEERAIAKVVTDLREALPTARVYVVDNASTDETVQVAREAGAIVRREPRKGKGNVVRRSLADIDADVYLMIDGDDTYDAAAAPLLVEALLNGPNDMVTGVRHADGAGAYRAGHELGNRGFNLAVSHIFGYQVTDMLSGYRAFSRRYVKSFPAVSREFEIETELTVHAINNRMPTAEVVVGFRDRGEGSESKLNTYRDGTRILGTIVKLLHHERPKAFYGSAAALMFLAAIGFATPLLVEYLMTGLVPRLPTAMIVVCLVVCSLLTLAMGVILNGQRKIRQEQSRLAYLRYAAVVGPDEVHERRRANLQETTGIERATGQQRAPGLENLLAVDRRAG